MSDQSELQQEGQNILLREAQDLLGRLEKCMKQLPSSESQSKVIDLLLAARVEVTRLMEEGGK